MNIFDNWRQIPQSRFQHNPTKQLLAKKRISSAAMIDYLADACGVTTEEVRKVIDGFWQYVCDKQHYQQGQYLVVPHFGTFRRAVSQRGAHPKRVLIFRSRPVAELDEWLDKSPGPSSRWIEKYENEQCNVANLSVKRRIAVHISNAKGISLDVAYCVLWAMLDITCHILRQGGHEIAWACRGVMRPADLGSARRYKFWCYQRLSASLNGEQL